MFSFKTANSVKFDEVFDAFFNGIEHGIMDAQISDSIREFDGGFVVDIELPGIKKSAVTISLDNNVLTVTATKTKVTDGTFTSDTRRYGKFSKKYKLNAPVSNSDITAKMEDGVLTITIPKTESAKSRTVNID